MQQFLSYFNLFNYNDGENKNTEVSCTHGHLNFSSMTKLQLKIIFTLVHIVLKVICAIDFKIIEKYNTGYMKLEFKKL